MQSSANLNSEEPGFALVPFKKTLKTTCHAICIWTVLLILSASADNVLAQTFHVGPLRPVQPTNISQQCYTFHHKYQIDPGNPQVRVEWDGQCSNGNAQGPGTIVIWVGKQLAARELSLLREGKRNGKATNISWSIHGKPYHITLQEFRDGYVCGEGAEYDMQGKRYVAFEGDCRGGMMQTSNPLDYLLQYLGGPSWQFRVLYKFMFNMDDREIKERADDVAQCIRIFTAGGFSRSVANSWCSLKW
jgi:hypothetical protein